MINIDKYDSAETNPYYYCNTTNTRQIKNGEGLEWPPLPNRC